MLAIFLIDSVVNFFVDIPIFVPFAIVMLPVLWFNLWKSGRKNIFLLIFFSVFILVSVINNFVYEFDKTNISDLVFILFFPSSYYFYKLRPEKLHGRSIHVFFLLSMLMFSLAFAGMNSQSFQNESRGWNKTMKPAAEKTIVRERDQLDIVESIRTYNYGLFRVPHLATYFFGFLFLFYGFTFQKNRKWYFLLAALAALLCMLYSGSRTFLVAAFLALMLYWINRRTIFYLLLAVAAAVVMIIYRLELFQMLQHTFLANFAGLLITTFDNFSRLSRVIIWNSWWYEMQHFAWYDFLIGKTFVGSMEANRVNIHFREWFHNDFLSISYAYGMLALVLYVTFLYRVFKENIKYIRKNVFLFVFFFAMIFSAIFNGFYYYFPVFLIFVFVYMIRVQKKALRH
jgi:hypothetical protein